MNLPISIFTHGSYNEELRIENPSLVLRPEIPIYCSEATKLLMQATQDVGATEDYVYFEECFQTYINKKGTKSRKRGKDKRLRNIKVIDYRKHFNIDSIEVEPISVDHSLPGVTGFIVHTSNGSIGYTADIRFHGRRQEKSEKFVENCGKSDFRCPQIILFLLLRNYSLLS